MFDPCWRPPGIDAALPSASETVRLKGVGLDRQGAILARVIAMMLGSSPAAFDGAA